VTNQGVVTLVGGVDGSDPSIAYSAELLVDNVTFQGGGSVVLSGNAEAAIITGTTASTRLFNVDNTIAGAGLLGDQSLFLVNQDAGVIDADVSGKTLLVDTGANAIINRGTFGASNGGTLVVASPVRRAGLGVIDGGTLEFQSSVDAAVSFSANGGSLVLDNSTTFRGSVAGLGDNDLSAIDFMDIGFASVSASFSENGTLTGGTLRLRDGDDVARVMLLGDFASNFSVAPPPGYVGFVLADDQTANHGTLVSYLGP